MIVHARFKQFSLYGAMSGLAMIQITLKDVEPILFYHDPLRIWTNPIKNEDIENK